MDRITGVPVQSRRIRRRRLSRCRRRRCRCSLSQAELQGLILRGLRQGGVVQGLPGVGQGLAACDLGSAHQVEVQVSERKIWFLCAKLEIRNTVAEQTCLRVFTDL